MSSITDVEGAGVREEAGGPTEAGDLEIYLCIYISISINRFQWRWGLGSDWIMDSFQCAVCVG